MKSCLVVDDSSVVRKVARRILEDMDLIVDEAEDGQEAIDKCRVEMPDAILLDWNMPVKSGLEFIKELRAYNGGDKPRIVFLHHRETTSAISPWRSRRAPMNTSSSPSTAKSSKASSTCSGPTRSAAFGAIYALSRQPARAV